MSHLKQYFSFIFLLFHLYIFAQLPSDKIIKGDHYELKIAQKQNAILILFPCFPCDIENTKSEAKFLNGIENEGITTILLDINQKLWLKDQDKNDIIDLIKNIINNHQLKNKNIYLGGFSSGGNVALLLSNYIVFTNSKIDLKGVFVVDSPIDLEKLYENAQKEIVKKSNEDALNEANFLNELFTSELGNPKEQLSTYQKYSPFLLSKNEFQNLSSLQKIKVRFYSEPAIDWQKTFRKRSYEDTNSFILDAAYQNLKDAGFKKIDYIKTENRGIRANGTIHPHSWNIVEINNLLKWIKS